MIEEKPKNKMLDLLKAVDSDFLVPVSFILFDEVELNLRNSDTSSKRIEIVKLNSIFYNSSLPKIYSFYKPISKII